MPNSGAGQLRRDQRQDWESVAAGWQRWFRTFEKGAYERQTDRNGKDKTSFEGS